MILLNAPMGARIINVTPSTMQVCSECENKTAFKYEEKGVEIRGNYKQYQFDIPSLHTKIS